LISTGKLLDYWEAPEGAGHPLACLATSFTFEPDFFENQCLGRFLELDTRRLGEASPELSFLIEQEERLAETRAVVLVDRSFEAAGRSLRWDVLPVAVERGVMHAKVTLLVWERLIRVIVGSANLTPAAYRRTVEAVVAFDAFDGSGVPRGIFDASLDGLREIVARTPGEPSEAGPRRRVEEILELAGERVAAFGLRDSPAKGDPRLVVSLVREGRPGLEAIAAVWRGGPPRSASVVSPFYDADGRTDAARMLGYVLAQRGPCTATFVLPTDSSATGTVVRAPASLGHGFRRGIDVRFRAFRTPEEEEPRRLHAKVVVLESDGWIAALVGSSNFTSPGLAAGPGANLELNALIGAPAGSSYAESIWRLVRAGEELDPAELEWEPESDPEEEERPALPLGFWEARLAPGDPMQVLLRLSPERGLPLEWSVTTPAGTPIVGHEDWDSGGRRSELATSISEPTPPFFLVVEWLDREGRQQGTWPVNVTDPALLPPPEEFRALSASALLEALASTRPIHEAVARAIERERRGRRAGRRAEDLDPLVRHAESARLLRHARRVAAALAGLRRRLERPVSSEDALRWRLAGPLGPRELAERIAAERDAGDLDKAEAAFTLAELALTLSRVDWNRAVETLSEEFVAAQRGELMRRVSELHDPAALEPEVAAYVKRALEVANP
jgi:hypothetical protein